MAIKQQRGRSEIMIGACDSGYEVDGTREATEDNTAWSVDE